LSRGSILLQRRVTQLAENLDIDLEGDPDSLKVLLAGRDVSDLIRTEQVTDVSSVVSTIPECVEQWSRGSVKSRSVVP
jgi:cytidylate kinase